MVEEAPARAAVRDRVSEGRPARREREPGQGEEPQAGRGQERERERQREDDEAVAARLPALEPEPGDGDEHGGRAGGGECPTHGGPPARRRGSHGGRPPPARRRSPTPAAASLRSSGSAGDLRPAKLAESTQTSETPWLAPARRASSLERPGVIREATTTSSWARAAGPPSRASVSSSAGDGDGSTPASVSSAARQSPSSDATGTTTGGRALTTSTQRRPRATWVRRIEPAARTAPSRLSPATPRSSASSRIAISSRGESSSSLTIRRPRRAVVGQCTFRSDSPCSYSRTEWRSKPVGRRRSSRRPSWAWAPASEKREPSSTSRG